MELIQLFQYSFHTNDNFINITAADFIASVLISHRMNKAELLTNYTDN